MSMVKPGPMPPKQRKATPEEKRAAKIARARANQWGEKGWRPKPRKRLPRKSAKRREEEILYDALRKAFLHAHPRCQMILSRFLDGQQTLAQCRSKATDVHHKRGRGKYYLDDTTWMAICRQHHKWIHDNMKEAEALGYITRVRS